MHFNTLKRERCILHAMVNTEMIDAAVWPLREGGNNDHG